MLPYGHEALGGPIFDGGRAGWAEAPFQMNDVITVYSAEVMRRLRSRTFFFGLIFGIIGVAVIIELPQWFNSYSRQTDRILLAGEPQIVAAARPLLAKDFVVAGDWRGSL